MTSPVVIVNPKSANGATGRHWPQLSRRLGEVLGSFETVFTQACGDGTPLARAGVRGGAELVVSVGGDGTHNEVVNGLFADSVAINDACALAVVPAGTGGDLRRSLGLPSRPADTIAALTTTRRRIDLGRVQFLDARGEAASRLFLNVSSCGVSGRVVEVVNRSGKWLGGRLSFALGSARALFDYRDQAMVVRVDGGAPRSLSVTSLAVANGRFFGGGMQVAPTALLDDGLLNVTVWQGFKLSDFIVKAPKLYDGSHVSLPGVETLTAKRVAVESRERVLVELDGEQPGQLPAVWDILPGALWLSGGPGVSLAS